MKDSHKIFYIIIQEVSNNDLFNSIILPIIIGILTSILSAWGFYYFFERRRLRKEKTLEMVEYFSCNYFLENFCYNPCEVFYKICAYKTFLSSQRRNKAYNKLLNSLTKFLEEYSIFLKGKNPYDKSLVMEDEEEKKKFEAQVIKIQSQILKIIK